MSEGIAVRGSKSGRVISTPETFLSCELLRLSHPSFLTLMLGKNVNIGRKKSSHEVRTSFQKTKTMRLRRGLKTIAFLIMAVVVTLFFRNKSKNTDYTEPKKMENLKTKNFTAFLSTISTYLHSESKATSTIYDEKYQIENDLAARRLRKESVCREYGLDQRTGEDDLHRVKPWEYFIQDKHKLVWCNVFKSGSSR